MLFYKCVLNSTKKSLVNVINQMSRVDCSWKSKDSMFATLKYMNFFCYPGNVWWKYRQNILKRQLQLYYFLHSYAQSAFRS